MKKLLPVAALFLLWIAPAPGVAATPTEGLTLDERGEAVVFRVERADAASVRVQVFDDESGTVLFDSGWSPAGPVEWRPSAEVGRPWRYRVEVRDRREALILSHTGIREAGALEAAPLASSHGPSVMNVGSAGSTGSLRTFREGSAVAVSQLGSTSGGGQLRLLDEDGFTTARVEPDTNGTGTFFSLSRDQGETGFFFDGNASGSGEPLMALTGSARSAVFDMSKTGPAAVQLPGGSIHSTEIFNEPGGASSNGGGLLDSGSLLTSKNVFAPSGGFVLALGTVEMSINHEQGTDDDFTVGISLDSTTIPPEQSFNTHISSHLPTVFLDEVVTVHGLFAVDPGLHTFRFLVNGLDADNLFAGTRQLSLVYLPTTYGGVATISSGQAAAEEPVPESWESQELLDRIATEELTRERLEGELRTMRERLDGLEQLLDHQGRNRRP